MPPRGQKRPQTTNLLIINNEGGGIQTDQRSILVKSKKKNLIYLFSWIKKSYSFISFSLHIFPLVIHTPPYSDYVPQGVISFILETTALIQQLCGLQITNISNNKEISFFPWQFFHSSFTSHADVAFALPSGRVHRVSYSLYLQLFVLLTQSSC